MMIKSLILVITTFLHLSAHSEEFYPQSILKTDSFFSHHTLVVEKLTHTLHLFKNSIDGRPKLVKKVQIATGKKPGNKIFQGDFRTPEGIYHFNDFLTHKALVKRHGKAGAIYGVGAFVMNYPNVIDRRLKKTGSGIWLHSTNDENRIDKGLDSRGCIVSANDELINLSKFIELNKTPIIVVESLKFLQKKTWTAARTKIESMLSSWLTSWQQEDINEYISHYHPTRFKSRKPGGIAGYKEYKKSVFWGAGKPQIEMSNISILVSKNYAIVYFEQSYTSKTIQDTGKKTLYLQKDPYYNWKIVSENWEKLEDHNHQKGEKLTFTPAMRFFESSNPNEILTGEFNLIHSNKAN